MQQTTVLRSVRDMDVAGKRVLLRTSLNVPVLEDGSVGDMFRLKRGLKTIEYLASKGARIVLVGYIGREGATLAPVASTLQGLLPNIKISFTDRSLSEVGEQVEALSGSECLMLENIRRESGEEKNDPALAEALAALADVFVDDAFAEAHRAYASNVGVASLLPSCAGFLFEEEVQKLSEALMPPEKSLAIVGGAKFETKEPLIQKLLSLYPKIILGGALASDLLKSHGWPFGASLVSGKLLPTELAVSEKLLEPSDVIVGEKDENAERTILVNDIRENEYVVDIGPETAGRWAEEIMRAEFVLWNGPMGVYEKGYVAATDTLADALVRSTCRAVVGGGDTVAAVANYTFDPERIFLSTGGGAMLQFLADGTLPAIEVLKSTKP